MATTADRTTRAASPTRRSLATMALLLAVGAATVGDAAAQAAYPNRTIRVVIPFAPGGAGDIIGRPIMKELGERIGQPIVIENKGGASGLIAVTDVAKSAPDGYSLLLTHIQNVVMFPAMEPDLPFNNVKHFDPVINLVTGPLVLLVRPELPIKSLAELVAYAKARPGKMTYGAVGTGGTTHLSPALLESMAGIQLLHVPYKGIAPVFTDLMAGQIDMAFAGMSAGIPHIRTGKLRPIAVASPTRSSLVPDIPAIAESYPGYEMTSWYGVVAPAGTPRDVVNRLNQELAAVLKLPRIVEFLKTSGLEAVGNTPEQFQAQIRRDSDRWTPVIQRLGLVKQGK